MHIDCVILVDGGTDSLMRGDEKQLGTPTEDMTSIAAVSMLDSVKICSFLYTSLTNITKGEEKVLSLHWNGY